MKKVKGLLAVCFLVTLMGCGKSGINGDWYLYMEALPNSQFLTAEDLDAIGTHEVITIKGDKAHYKGETMLSEEEFDLKVETIDENTYNFYYDDGYLFAENVKFDGQNLTFDVDKPDQNWHAKMYYKRKQIIRNTYFLGDKELEKVIDCIQNRVQLVLDEATK